MALMTVSVAAVGLAASTLLVAGSSRVDPVEAEPATIVCQNMEFGYQRTLPAGSHCIAKVEVEVEVTPTP
jgi:hypothetical protein